MKLTNKEIWEDLRIHQNENVEILYKVRNNV